MTLSTNASKPSNGSEAGRAIAGRHRRDDEQRNQATGEINEENVVRRRPFSMERILTLREVLI